MYDKKEQSSNTLLQFKQMLFVVSLTEEKGRILTVMSLCQQSFLNLLTT